MGVFSIPVTIGIDEQRIAKEIETNVEKQVVDKITNEVKRVIYGRRYYNTRDFDENDLSPVVEMVREAIDGILEKHEQEIIDGAITKLADRLSRKKTVKTRAEEITDG